MPTIPSNAVPAVLALLEHADEVLRLGGKLLKLCCQTNPELNEEPVPDAGAEMDRAREEALKRESTLHRPKR